MRTISLWQPWAELVARELKCYETRDSPCTDFGPIAIHAAKRKFRDPDMTREARTQMLMDEVDPFTLQYGVVLCVAEVVGCRRVEVVRGQLSLRELLYGNYNSTCLQCQGDKFNCSKCNETGIIQRYAWRLANVRRFPNPVTLKGHQKFYYWAEAKFVMKEQGLL